METKTQPQGQNVIEVIKELSKEYNRPIKVMIGTPCYGGMLTVDYTTSLLKTKSIFQQLGVEIEVAFLSNESLIPRGRNTIVAKFLANKSCTHLMFIDADITWEPAEIVKLLISKKNLVGGCYPKKKYNFDKISEYMSILQEHADEFHNGKLSTELLKAKITDYVMNFGVSPKREGNLLSLKHIGTGFMLISRKCLDQFKRDYSYLKYKDDHGVLTVEEDAELFSFFDTDIAEGHYLSEDYLFCKRWEDISEEGIWIDLTIKLSHTGPHKFEGNYLLSIMDIYKTVAESKSKKKAREKQIQENEENKDLVEEIMGSNSDSD